MERSTPAYLAGGGAMPLWIGGHDAAAERNADVLADHAMTPAEPGRQDSPPVAGGASSGEAAAPAPVIVFQVLQGAGQPLGAGTRSLYESRFGQDLSDVRVHSGQHAAASAEAIDASAYTVGNQVVLGSGVEPSSAEAGDNPVLAHELAHVVQHKAGGDGAVRRAPPDKPEKKPTTAKRVEAVEKREDAVEERMAIVEKKQAATALDARWRARFGERLASFRAAVYRVSGGIDSATQRFAAVQTTQAQSDALRAQIIMGLGAVIFAGAFEWLVTSGLGAIGNALGKVSPRVRFGGLSQGAVEALENPANTFVSGMVNVGGVVTGTNSQKKGQPPAVQRQGGGDRAGGAVDVLTGNLEDLELQNQTIEGSFVARADALRDLSDEQWKTFDVGAQETAYQGLLKNLEGAGDSVESMKGRGEVALIIERHLWAKWIVQQRQFEIDVDDLKQAMSDFPLREKTEPDYDVGSDIEDGLNAAGIAKEAGVTLTGHWYSSNSPSNWKRLLLRWAAGYKTNLRI